MTFEHVMKFAGLFLLLALLECLGPVGNLINLIIMVMALWKFTA